MSSKNEFIQSTEDRRTRCTTTNNERMIIKCIGKLSVIESCGTWATATMTYYHRISGIFIGITCGHTLVSVNKNNGAMPRSQSFFLTMFKPQPIQAE